MKIRYAILVLCAAASLGGCAMIPRYDRPTTTVPATYPGTSDGESSTAANLGWRDVFADERLKALIDLALTNSLDLRVAALKVEQNRAQYRIARANLVPAGNVNEGFTRSRAQGTTTDNWNASIGTSAYELDFFGRIRSLNQQALEKFLATDEARRSTQISVVAEVASQYFSLREAQAQHALAVQTLATVGESYTLNKATFDAGASNELDLRSAETQVQATKITALTYERQISQAENLLVLLIGQPLPSNLPAWRALSDPNLVSEVPAGLPSDLVRRRPDILQAEHTLRAANANIGAARAAFFPSVKFTASAGTTSSQFDQLFGAGTGVWSFSPQITVPIFTGGQNRADLDAAKITARIEVANYQKTIQTAFREVADALVVTQSYTQQIAEQAALIAALQRRFELADARHRHGEAPYLEVLIAQQDLFTAKQNQIATRLNQLNAQVALYRALGGGWR